MSEYEQLTHLLASGRIGRREFMAGVSALGMAAALPASTAKAAQPKKGGRLRMGISSGGTTDSLDPGTISDTPMMNISRQLRNNLTEAAPDGSLIGELAESWEASDDAVTWRFKLRKGVEFHNGKSLEAEDVVASINLHRGPDTTSAATGMTDPIADIKTDGKHTAVFTLKGGNADFAFGMSDYHLPIMPAKDGGVDWQSGMGTGAFVLESFEAGVRSFAKRNPNYWKEGRGHFDEVETLTINDTTARVSALQTGETDVMNRCDLKTVDRLEEADDIKVYNVAGMKHITMPMRTDTDPYTNNDLRLALKFAIDREQLVDTVLRGYGTVGNDHPIATVNRYFGRDIPQRQYDPDKARFHLKKSGLEGQEFELHVSDAAFGGAVDSAVMYKEHAAKAGINIKLIREPIDGYWSRVWLKMPWCVSFWSGRPTEDWMFSLGYARGAKWNATKWDHDRFNDLLVAARAELDEAKRRDMYAEMQLLVRDEGGVVIPMFLNHVYATTTRIQTEEKHAGNFGLDGNMSAERWWFA